MSAEESVEPGKSTVDEKKETRRMSRREYLCLGAGVAVGAALGGAATYALTPQVPKETFSGKGATKVKITVLRTLSMNEVHPKGLPVKPTYSEVCDIFTEGQEFYVDAERPQSTLGLQPGRFCIYAWEAIFPVAWKYYERGGYSKWYGDSRVTVMPCPDGLRPVIFKLEWI